MEPGDIELGENVQSATISAKIIHADGTVEELGIIAQSAKPEDEPEDE